MEFEEELLATLADLGIPTINSKDFADKIGVYIAVCDFNDEERKLFNLRCSTICPQRYLAFPLKDPIVYFRKTVAGSAVLSDLIIDISVEIESNGIEWDEGGMSVVVQTSDTFSIKDLSEKVDHLVGQYDKAPQTDVSKLGQAIILAARIIADSNSVRGVRMIQEKEETKRFKAEIEVKAKVEMEKMKKENNRIVSERRSKYKRENDELRKQIKDLEDADPLQERELNLETERLRKRVAELEEADPETERLQKRLKEAYLEAERLRKQVEEAERLRKQAEDGDPETEHLRKQVKELTVEVERLKNVEKNFKKLTKLKKTLQ